MSEKEVKVTGWKRLLSGRIENKTKEAALAATLLTLFFLVRSFKIPLVPGVFLLDFSGAVIYTAALIFSWPYTLIFSLSNVYLGSNLFGILGWFVGTQTVFFLSKIVNRKLVPHIMVSGAVAGPISYGLVMHAAGMMDFRVYLATCTIPALLHALATYVGGMVLWAALRRFEIVE